MAGLILVAEMTGENRLEFSSWRHILNRAHCLRVLQTLLRSSDDKWFSKVAKHLASQDVEVVGRGRDIGHLEVDVETVERLVRIYVVWIVNIRIDVLQEALDVAG